jgi:nitroreductase
MSGTPILNTIEAIEQRRSVKSYDKTHLIPEEDIQQILSLALLAPTSFNIQHWRFVVADRRDPALREALKIAAFGQVQVEDASLVVIVCADVTAWKNAEFCWHLAPQATKDYMLPAIFACYQDNPGLALSEAQRSCAMAAQTIMLAAKSLGYDTCPMAGFDPAQVGKLIHLPENHIVNLLITVGKASKPAYPRSGQLPYNDVVFRQHF